MADYCHGNGEDHCCWLNGEICQFLEENTVPGRRWACGFLRRLGSWDAVAADPIYQREVGPHMTRLGLTVCNDFPPEGQACNACGLEVANS